MEFKMVSPNNSEEQDVSPFPIQNYEDLSINLVHEGKKLSEVWKYYGLLYNGNTVMNPHRYYCSLCLKELLENINNGFKVSFSTIHNVSISTATGNLKMHLFKGHSISTFPESEKEKYDACFVVKAENRKIRPNVNETRLGTNNIESDINHIMVNNSLEIGLTEVCLEDTHSLMNSYSRMKTSLKQRLQTTNSVTILGATTFNPNISCSYLKLSAAFIDSRWELNNFFLCYTPLKCLSSECLRFHYESVLKEFCIENPNNIHIHLVCTKMLPLPRMPFISDQELCLVFLTHQLITKTGLYSSLLFTNLLDKCLNILSLLNFRGFSCLEDSLSEDSKYEYLSELADTFFIVKLDERNPLLCSEVGNPSTDSEENCTSKHIVRVSVVLHLFKFIEKYKNSVTQSLAIIGQSQFILNETEINIIKNSLKFLCNFEELPDIFRDCNNTLIVVPVLKNKMKEFCEASNDDVEAVQQIKSSILSQLDEYYQMTPLVKMACILDPSVRDILDKDDTCHSLVDRLRSSLNTDGEGGRNSGTALQFVAFHQSMKSPSTLKTETIPSTSKKLKLLRSLEPQYQIPEYEGSFMKEVRQYLQHLPTVEESETPLLFWKNHSHTYPNLSVLAREHLAVPSYCSSPDSILSISSLKTHHESINVNLFKLNTVTFVRSNMELLNH